MSSLNSVGQIIQFVPINRRDLYRNKVIITDFHPTEYLGPSCDRFVNRLTINPDKAISVSRPASTLGPVRCVRVCTQSSSVNRGNWDGLIELTRRAMGADAFENLLNDLSMGRISVDEARRVVVSALRLYNTPSEISKINIITIKK